MIVSLVGDFKTGLHLKTSTQKHLFDIAAAPSQVGNGILDQYFTPEWAAQELVEQFFGDLSASDLVLEPCCGRGAFLKAVPAEVNCIGVEIDAGLAREAETLTGRQVLVGDFRTIELPEKPTAIVGNPPFKTDLLSELLDRAKGWLPENGRCGLILSMHMIQTPNTVLRWNDDWSLEQRILPRTLFPRAIRPLIFMMFTKDRVRRMLGGFALYKESAEINEMSAAAKLLLVHGKPRKSCWRAVVEWALGKLGGKATLRDLYGVIEGARPTQNQWWKEKVRQTLQRYFVSADRGVWEVKHA